MHEITEKNQHLLVCLSAPVHLDLAQLPIVPRPRQVPAVDGLV